MAFDKTGKYHMNPHHAKMADERGAPPKKEAKEGSPKEEATEPKAEAEAEGDVPKALEDLHAKMGGTHMHVHIHDGGVTTHHIGEDGVVDGPHEHPDMAGAADHMHMVHGGGGGQPPMTGGAIPMHGSPTMSGY